MNTATPRRPLASLLEAPMVADFRTPERLRRLPPRVSVGGLLCALLVLSAFLRTRQVGGQLWFNEAIATGIASHSVSEIFGVVRHGGSAPLYYLLLHFWVSGFGTGESATHAFSLAAGLLSIPAALWAGWSLFGPRAGIFAAVLFAFSSYLTRYAEETQLYELIVLLSVFAVAGFIQGFVHRRRGHLVLFTIAMTLMLYTQDSAVMLWLGAAVALIPVYLASDDRRGLPRDAALAFGATVILYLPWLPATIHQIGHATSPWHYTPLVGATVPSDLLGGERVDVVLLVCAVVGLAPLFARANRRTPAWSAMWALLAMLLTAFVLARVASIVTPSWVARYFGPMIAPLLLFAASAAARARVIGLVAIVLTVLFCLNPSSFALPYKSDMRDVAGEIGSRLHPGDLVVVGQPEQTPLAWYYLPAGLRYASTAGPVSDPRSMNWDDALSRLQDARPDATLGPLVASLKPGQQLLYVRPLTEGIQNWEAPWTQLVRRRAAQWGAILESDDAAGTLKPVAWAPHNYRSACCVASSATLYEKAP